jgi:hypothetical protein
MAWRRGRLLVKVEPLSTTAITPTTHEVHEAPPRLV